uniref:Reverse transcriptase Ty1/copia-type domain-containing protein n=1 Tax=Peronospora matthiolae TaxID=2874970 RepID=A0AAV1USB9_9STRA
MPVSEETLQAQGVSNASELVFRLRKSLYGLKQAGRLWSQLLHSKLITAGFTRSTGTSAAAVERFFDSLASLSIKDLGRVNKFLGMRVTHNGQNGYTLDQEEAIRDLLRDNGLAEANSTWTPIDDSCYELEEGDAELLGTPSAQLGPTGRQFQSLVGSLLWVARCTRPDIAFAVHKVTRRAHAP